MKAKKVWDANGCPAHRELPFLSFGKLTEYRHARQTEDGKNIILLRPVKHARRKSPEKTHKRPLSVRKPVVPASSCTIRIGSRAPEKISFAILSVEAARKAHHFRAVEKIFRRTAWSSGSTSTKFSSSRSSRSISRLYPRTSAGIAGHYGEFSKFAIFAAIFPSD